MVIVSAGKHIQDEDFETRAVALLMGCSSGKIKHTSIGGTGTPLEYLLSGSPAIVGFLWNITDKDCDRYKSIRALVTKRQEYNRTGSSLVDGEKFALKSTFAGMRRVY